MSGNLERMMQRYEEMFGESFPIMLCRGMSDSDISAIIAECLNRDRRYEDMDGLIDY